MWHDTYVFKLLYESFHFRETRQPLHHLVETGQTISLCYIISSQLHKVFNYFRFNKFIHYLSTQICIYRLLIFLSHNYFTLLLLSINFHVDLDHHYNKILYYY